MYVTCIVLGEGWVLYDITLSVVVYDWVGRG